MTRPILFILGLVCIVASVAMMNRAPTDLVAMAGLLAGWTGIALLMLSVWNFIGRHF